MVERLAERDGARVHAADGTAEGDGPEAVLMRRIVDAWRKGNRSEHRSPQLPVRALIRDKARE
jgi:hypothetical protein